MIRRVLPVLKPYRAMVFIMVLMGLFSSLADSAFPLFNRYALDHFVAGGTLKGIGLFAALYVGVLLMQVAANYISMSYVGQIEVTVNRDLRNMLFRHLQSLSFSYFNQNSVGYIHARVMSDTGKIGSLLSWRMMDVVWNASYLIFILVVMFRINARLALWILLLLPAAILAGFYFQRKLVAVNRQVRESNSRIVGNINEGVTGVRSIKTLVIEDRISRDFEEETGNYQRMAVKAGHYSALFTSGLTFASAAALALVLWQGGSLTEKGWMQIGTLSVFMSYALGMIEPIQYLVHTVSAAIEVKVNIERVTKLLETAPDVADPPEVVERYGDMLHPKRENWEELKGEVEFQDVSFHYPDGEELVLEHFNLKVPQGTNVAIVGETGAGKTTLVNLVCRFFEPTQGRVLIDGRDARERSQLWLHSNIGYVLQTPHLFSGTVRENLLYGNPEASEEEIAWAVGLVAAGEVIERLGGLDAQVGEGGDMLSTGEKQLLSFARAILADPRILILDEATSSIDTVTEAKIRDAIRTVIRGRTSFIIAHRLSTIIQADVILVIRDGKIIERGTHDELMELGGYYHDLYTSQAFPE
ncbi:MAG: ABC transporter ATP-binding protein/permease [Lachnospiraceae bacterium]|nr:ABC transporter ATP-binding protein/permease [Lachnospiraceae bacterium]